MRYQSFFTADHSYFGLFPLLNWLPTYRISRKSQSADRLTRYRRTTMVSRLFQFFVQFRALFLFIESKVRSALFFFLSEWEFTVFPRWSEIMLPLDQKRTRLRTISVSQSISWSKCFLRVCHFMFGHMWKQSMFACMEDITRWREDMNLMLEW